MIKVWHDGNEWRYGLASRIGEWCDEVRFLTSSDALAFAWETWGAHVPALIFTRGAP